MLSVEAIVSLLLIGGIIASMPLNSHNVYEGYFAYEKANNIADMLVRGAPREYLDTLAGGYCYEIDDESRCSGEVFEAWRSEWKETIGKRYVRVYLK